jgi:MFS family permease
MITPEQIRLSHRYIAYKTLSSLWFVSAVWLYFYRIFLTDYQIGILDGVAFAIGLVAEVPSGALADKFGRAKMVKFGQVLVGSGLLMQVFGGFVPIFVGQSVMMIGVSFVSGADEALFFQKLNFARNSVNWRKLVTRAAQAALCGMVLATVIGAWMHTLNPRLPWIFTGISFLASVCVVWPIKDVEPDKIKQKFIPEVMGYFIEIKNGFQQFCEPKFLLYVPVIITVQGLFYAAGWGLLRLVLLDRFHFAPVLGSFVIASSSLITVGILAYMHKYAENLSEKRVITLISLGATASLLVAVADVGMLWGYFVLLALYAGEYILHPFLSEVLNHRAEERQRATVLSIASFLRTLPYVALAPIIGYLNMHDNLEYFLVGWAILMAVAIALYLSLKKKDIHVSLVQDS